MPACGCPDVKLSSGEIRKCTCVPCAGGNMNDCTCNKETGCACGQGDAPCVCGPACTCDHCTCEKQKAEGLQPGGSCHGEKKAT